MPRPRRKNPTRREIAERSAEVRSYWSPAELRRRCWQPKPIVLERLPVDVFGGVTPFEVCAESLIG